MAVSTSTLQPFASAQEAQNYVRSVDMSLYQSVSKLLGNELTFAYSTLAGCCALLDAQSVNSEVTQFCSEVVKPAVEACFKAIETTAQLSNKELKLGLIKILDQVKFYPEKTNFETNKASTTIDKINGVLTTGKLTLYKTPNQEHYYGGRIDVSEAVFGQVIAIMQEDGYQNPEDQVGSSFDSKGHVTTIGPRELMTNYDHLVEAHTRFVQEEGEEVDLRATTIRMGEPQSGRLKRVVLVNVEGRKLDAYRDALGLDEMQHLPHLSIFSQEIQVVPELKEMGIKGFLEGEEGPFLSQLKDALEPMFAQERE